MIASGVEVKAKAKIEAKAKAEVKGKAKAEVKGKAEAEVKGRAAGRQILDVIVWRQYTPFLGGHPIPGRDTHPAELVVCRFR